MGRIRGAVGRGDRGRDVGKPPSGTGAASVRAGREPRSCPLPGGSCCRAHLAPLPPGARPRSAAGTTRARAPAPLVFSARPLRGPRTRGRPRGPAVRALGCVRDRNQTRAREGGNAVWSGVSEGQERPPRLGDWGVGAVSVIVTWGRVLLLGESRVRSCQRRVRGEQQVLFHKSSKIIKGRGWMPPSAEVGLKLISWDMVGIRLFPGVNQVLGA